MIDEKLLIKEFKKLQGVDTLANMFISDVIKVIKKQPVLNTEDIDEVYLQVVKENAELKKKLAAEMAINVGIAINAGIEQGIKEASDSCHGCFGAANNDCQRCAKNTNFGSREDGCS